MIVYFFPFLKKAFVKINKFYEEGIPNVDTFVYYIHGSIQYGTKYKKLYYALCPFKIIYDIRNTQSIQIMQMRKAVKVEKTHTSHGAPQMMRPPPESSPSDDSDSSSTTSHVGPPRMTLSERYFLKPHYSRYITAI